MIVRWFQGDSNGNLYAYIMSTMHNAEHGTICDKHQATQKNINTEGKESKAASWHDKIHPVTGAVVQGKTRCLYLKLGFWSKIAGEHKINSDFALSCTAT